MGIVFIPLVVVAIGSAVFLGRAANTLNQVVEQPVYKLQTTARLQNQIRKAHALVKDYAVTPRYTLKTQFESEAQAAEAVFIEMLRKPFFGPREQTLLANVRREWKDSMVLANVIFSSDASRATLFQLDQFLLRSNAGARHPASPVQPAKGPPDHWQNPASSLTSPFSGTTVHRTAVCFRFTLGAAAVGRGHEWRISTDTGIPNWNPLQVCS